MTDPEFRRALNSTNEIQITFVGRKTGKKFSTPVWFVDDEEKLYLLPVMGTSTSWYKNILKNPTIELEASGKRATVKADSTKDEKLVAEVIERFRRKYGASNVKKYYPNPNVVVKLSV